MDYTTLTKVTGLELTEYRPNWHQGYTAHGLKIEIKINKKRITLVAGYNISEAELPLFYTLLNEPWELTKSYAVTRNVKTGEIAQLITEADQAFASRTFALKGTNTTRKTADEGYFEKTAQIMKLAIELEHWDFINRNALGFDGHDKLITIGKSTAFEAAKAVDPEYTGWREHIVPCTMIIEEAIRMVQEGTTIVDLAQMLKTNLAIVMLTTEEAAYVDSTYKTTMPQGWSFGDSVTARLDVMGVAY